MLVPKTNRGRDRFLWAEVVSSIEIHCKLIFLTLTALFMTRLISSKTQDFIQEEKSNEHDEGSGRPIKRTSKDENGQESVTRFSRTGFTYCRTRKLILDLCMKL